LPKKKKRTTTTFDPSMEVEEVSATIKDIFKSLIWRPWRRVSGFKVDNDFNVKRR